MGMELEDVTGRPRSERDLDDAERFLTKEIVLNPMALAKDGTPCIFHYMTLRDVIQEVRALRAQKAGG